MKLHYLAAVSMTALISSCGGGYEDDNHSSCDAERQAYIEKYGQPDQITMGDDGKGSYRWSYIHTTKGFGRVFNWGKIWSSCVIQDITLEPYLVAP